MFIMNDRRFDLRMPTENAVNLSWRDQTGQEPYIPADLEDTLTLDYQKQPLLGKVRHCKSGVSGFILGIEFEDGYQWSPRP
jgi:hypothetical protein